MIKLNKLKPLILVLMLVVTLPLAAAINWDSLTKSIANQLYYSKSQPLSNYNRENTTDYLGGAGANSSIVRFSNITNYDTSSTDDWNKANNDTAAITDYLGNTNSSIIRIGNNDSLLFQNGSKAVNVSELYVGIEKIPIAYDISFCMSNSGYTTSQCTYTCSDMDCIDDFSNKIKNNSVVLFRHGNYPFEVRSGASSGLYLDNLVNTTIYAYGANFHIKFTNTSSLHGLRIENPENVKIYGLQLYGNKTCGNSYNCFGVYVNNAREVLLENIRASNFLGFEIFLNTVNYTQNLKLINSRFDGLGVADVVGGGVNNGNATMRDITIQGNYINQSWEVGSYSGALVIVGTDSMNYIDNRIWGWMAYGVETKRTENGIAFGNILNKINPYAPSCKIIQSRDDSHNIIFTNNLIYNCEVAISGNNIVFENNIVDCNNITDTYCISVSANHSSISGNKIMHGFKGIVNTGSFNKISENILFNITRGDFPTFPIGLVQEGGISNIFDSNIIYIPPGYSMQNGIYFASGSINNTVTNNKIFNDGTITSTFVNLQSGTENNVIEGNLIFGSRPQTITFSNAGTNNYVDKFNYSTLPVCNEGTNFDKEILNYKGTVQYCYGGNWINLTATNTFVFSASNISDYLGGSDINASLLKASNLTTIGDPSYDVVICRNNSGYPLNFCTYTCYDYSCDDEIQSGINDLYTRNLSTMLIRPGDYPLANSIVKKGDWKRVYGSGMKNTVLRVLSQNITRFGFNYIWGYSGSFSSKGWEIAYMSLDGGYGQPGGPANSGGGLMPNSQGHFHHLDIYNQTYFGIYSSELNDTVISNIYFTGYGDGDRIGGGEFSRVVIKDIFFYGNKSGDYNIDVLYFDNSLIDGVYENNDTSSANVNVYMEPARDSIFKNIKTQGIISIQSDNGYSFNTINNSKNVLVEDVDVKHVVFSHSRSNTKDFSEWGGFTLRNANLKSDNYCVALIGGFNATNYINKFVIDNVYCEIRPNAATVNTGSGVHRPSGFISSSDYLAPSNLFIRNFHTKSNDTTYESYSVEIGQSFSSDEGWHNVTLYDITGENVTKAINIRHADDVKTNVPLTSIATTTAKFSTVEAPSNLFVGNNTDIRGNASIKGYIFDTPTVKGVSSDGLLMYYPFDTTTENPREDYSSYKNDLTLTGNAEINSSCLIGSCLLTKGGASAGYATIPQARHINISNQSFSFSFWIKGLNNSVKNQDVIVLGTGSAFTLIRWESNARMLAQFHDGVGSDTSRTPTGYGNDSSWHHFVVLKKFGEAPEIFIDGDNKSQSQTYQAVGQSTAAGPGYLARGSLSGIDYNGSLDEVMLFNRTLTVSEIKTLYSNGLSSKRLLEQPKLNTRVISVNNTDINVTNLWVGSTKVTKEMNVVCKEGSALNTSLCDLVCLSSDSDCAPEISAFASGKEVYFDGGTYPIGTQMTVGVNTIWKGEGAGKTIFSTTAAVFAVRSSGYGRFEFRDIHINGNSLGQGLFCDQTTQCKMIGITANNTAGNAAKIQGTDNFILEDFFFNNASAGPVNIATSKNGFISRGTISKTNGVSSDSFLFSGASNVNIVDLIILDAGYRGLHISGSKNIRADRVFVNVSGDVGILLDNGVNDTIITNSQVYNATDYGFASTDNNYRNQFVNNIGAYNRYGGIALDDTNHSIVSDNQFYNNELECVYLFDSSYNDISNNICLNNARNSATGSREIWTRTSSQYNDIHDNKIFSDYALEAIREENSNRVNYYRDNIIYTPNVGLTKTGSQSLWQGNYFNGSNNIWMHSKNYNFTSAGGALANFTRYCTPDGFCTNGLNFTFFTNANLSAVNGSVLNVSLPPADKGISMDNLVLYIQGNGNVDDYSDQQHRVIGNSNLIFTEGRFGKGMNFTANPSSGVHVATGTRMNLSNASYSVAFWLYPFTTSGDISLTEKWLGGGGYAWAIRRQAGGGTALNVYNGSSLCNPSSGSVTFEEREWHFLVATVNKETGYISLYKDGNLGSSGFNQCVIDSLLDTGSNITIGDRDQASFAQAYNGTIDEFMVFNVSLSSAQVKKLYERNFELTDNDAFPTNLEFDNSTIIRAGNLTDGSMNVNFSSVYVGNLTLNKSGAFYSTNQIVIPIDNVVCNTPSSGCNFVCRIGEDCSDIINKSIETGKKTIIKKGVYKINSFSPSGTLYSAIQMKNNSELYGERGAYLNVTWTSLPSGGISVIIANDVDNAIVSGLEINGYNMTNGTTDAVYGILVTNKANNTIIERNYVHDMYGYQIFAGTQDQFTIIRDNIAVGSGINDVIGGGGGRAIVSNNRVLQTNRLGGYNNSIDFTDTLFVEFVDNIVDGAIAFSTESGSNNLSTISRNLINGRGSECINVYSGGEGNNDFNVQNNICNNGMIYLIGNGLSATGNQVKGSGGKSGQDCMYVNGNNNDLSHNQLKECTDAGLVIVGGYGNKADSLLISTTGGYGIDLNGDIKYSTISSPTIRNTGANCIALRNGANDNNVVDGVLQSCTGHGIVLDAAHNNSVHGQNIRDVSGFSISFPNGARENSVYDIDSNLTVSATVINYVDEIVYSSIPSDSLCTLNSFFNGRTIETSTQSCICKNSAWSCFETNSTGKYTNFGFDNFTNSSHINISMVSGKIRVDLNVSNALCVALTGSAGLCDGSDDGGVGGSMPTESMYRTNSSNMFGYSTFQDLNASLIFGNRNSSWVNTLIDTRVTNSFVQVLGFSLESNSWKRENTTDYLGGSGSNSSIVRFSNTTWWNGSSSNFTSMILRGTITRDDDSNTQIQGSADQWNFVTGGSSRFTINNNGVQVSNGNLDLNSNSLQEVGNLESLIGNGSILREHNITFVNSTSSFGGDVSGTYNNIQIGSGVVSDTEVSSLSWSEINNYPSACTAGTYITQLDDSVTCTAADTSSTDDLNLLNFTNSSYINISMVNSKIRIDLNVSNTLCIALTGSSALCDGSDDGGAAAGMPAEINYRTNASNMFGYADFQTLNSSAIFGGRNDTWVRTLINSTAMKFNAIIVGPSTSDHANMTLSIVNKERLGDRGVALSVVSTNNDSSAVEVTGNESSRGTIKVTHNKPDGVDDSSASALSIAFRGASGSNSAAKGIFVNTQNTTGNIFQASNDSQSPFVVEKDGGLTITTHNDYGILVQEPDGTDRFRVQPASGITWIGGKLIPTSSNVYDLGDSTHIWLNLQVKNINMSYLNVSSNATLPNTIVIGTLNATRLNGSLDCSNIVGGTDSNFCTDLDTDTGMPTDDMFRTNASNMFGYSNFITLNASILRVSNLTMESNSQMSIGIKNLTTAVTSNSSLGGGNYASFNSSCSGFRFGTTGGWFLSCAP